MPYLYPYLDTNKRKTIYTTMVKSQLNYCPLVCMFYLRRLLLLSSLLSSRYVIFMSSIMSSLFEIRENTHNTRYFQVLSNESRRTVNYGLETTCYRAPFLRTNLPPEYKLANSLNIFKRKIKNWEGEHCPCRLCKRYVRELGYI